MSRKVPDHLQNKPSGVAMPQGLLAAIDAAAAAHHPPLSRSKFVRMICEDYLRSIDQWPVPEVTSGKQGAGSGSLAAPALKRARKKTKAA